jgi:hypothetical protein
MARFWGELHVFLVLKLVSLGVHLHQLHQKQYYFILKKSKTRKDGRSYNTVN